MSESYTDFIRKYNEFLRKWSEFSRNDATIRANMYGNKYR